jgi:hypothetical protein
MVFALTVACIPLLFPAGGEPQRWLWLFAHWNVADRVGLFPSKLADMKVRL